MSFIAGHWHGMAASPETDPARVSRPARRLGAAFSVQAFRLGLAHGLYCLGCCWTLMLLMFAVGAGSIGWMLALGAVMAVEKNLPWGRRLSSPLGVILIAAGLLTALGLGL